MNAESGRLTSLQQLQGKRPGVGSATTHQAYFRQRYPQIIAVPYDSYIKH
ncbi:MULTISPECIES: hypothetical protein [unclassified Erwinia]|nr:MULTISPECIES: hypothetical protein [unclassified Erwinia]